MAAPEIDPDPQTGKLLSSLRQLDREISASEALRVTINVLRTHPRFPEWYRSPGQDTAHDLVVRMWRSDPAVARGAPLAAEGTSRHNRYLAGLVDAAERFLEDQDEALAHAWAYVTTSAAWPGLPQSARDFYLVLHGKAAEPGQAGGPHVAMAHRVMLTMAEHLTGRRYSLPTVTNARVALVKAGVVTAEVGRRHPASPGARCRSTVYNLLPEPLVSELVLCAREGLVKSEIDAPRPRWTDRDRSVFASACKDRRDARQAEAARLRAGGGRVTGPAEPGPGFAFAGTTFGEVISA